MIGFKPQQGHPSTWGTRREWGWWKLKLTLPDTFFCQYLRFCFRGNEIQFNPILAQKKPSSKSISYPLKNKRQAELIFFSVFTSSHSKQYKSTFFPAWIYFSEKISKSPEKWATLSSLVLPLLFLARLFHLCLNCFLSYS